MFWSAFPQTNIHNILVCTWSYMVGGTWVPSSLSQHYLVVFQNKEYHVLVPGMNFNARVVTQQKRYPHFHNWLNNKYQGPGWIESFLHFPYIEKGGRRTKFSTPISAKLLRQGSSLGNCTMAESLGNPSWPGNKARTWCPMQSVRVVLNLSIGIAGCTH